MDINVVIDTVAAGLVNVLTAYVVAKNFNATGKVLIAFAFSALLGAARTYLEGKFNAGDITQSLTYIFAASQVIYATYGKKITQPVEENYGITKAVPAAPVPFPEQAQSGPDTNKGAF